MTEKKVESKKESKIFPIIILAGAGIVAYFLLKPEYPKNICRDPYCFEVYNEEEETHLKDFLGIEPPGEDIDTYLSKLTQIELDEWRSYWIPIWTNFGRNDIVSFVDQMYNKYSGVVAVSATIDSFTITAN